MIQAKEAAKIAEAVLAKQNEEKSNKQIAAYSEAIKNAAERGCRSVAAGTLYAATIAALKERGYKVESVDYYDSLAGYDYEISW